MTNNQNNNNKLRYGKFYFSKSRETEMGKGMIARLAKEIPSDKRIMITFGGGSVKKNGEFQWQDWVRFPKILP